MIIWRGVLVNIIIMAYLNKLILKSNLKGPMSQLVNMESSFFVQSGCRTGNHEVQATSAECEAREGREGENKRL